MVSGDINLTKIKFGLVAAYQKCYRKWNQEAKFKNVNWGGCPSCLGKSVTSPPAPILRSTEYTLWFNRSVCSANEERLLFPWCTADGMAGRWEAVCLEAACQPQGSPFLSHFFFLSKVKNESSRWLKESWALCQYIYTIILNQKRFPHGRFVQPTSELFSRPATPLTRHHFQELSPADVCQKRVWKRWVRLPSFLNFDFYLCSVREICAYVPVCVHACGGPSLLSVWCLPQ